MINDYKECSRSIVDPITACSAGSLFDAQYYYVGIRPMAVT
jgi:hypothetical protein